MGSMRNTMACDALQITHLTPQPLQFHEWILWLRLTSIIKRLLNIAALNM
jgi:hypothetical protein